MLNKDSSISAEEKKHLSKVNGKNQMKRLKKLLMRLDKQ